MSTSPRPEHARSSHPAIGPDAASAADVAANRVLPRKPLWLLGGVLASVVSAMVYLLSASVVAMLVVGGVVAVGFGVSIESMVGWMARAAQRRQDDAGERL
jgi:Na+/melibiose symporter-like transporter